jgi:hypothetical protein
VAGHYPTYGGHEIFGRGSVVGRHGTMMLTHQLGLLPGGEPQADEVRIWSNWVADVPSDYGRLSDDDRWLVTNGTAGAVAGKAKNDYYHEQVYRGVAIADVVLPDFIVVPPAEVEARREVALRERLEKMPGFFDAIRKALVIEPHVVDIVPVPRQT